MKHLCPVLIVLLAACGRDTAPSLAKKEQESSAKQIVKVDPATAVQVRGTVRFLGKKPARKRISMDSEEACEKMHKAPVFDASLITAKDNALVNAFVYIKEGLEGMNFEASKMAVVIDQRGCQFVPRVVGLRSGQTLTVKNSDPVSHSIHPQPKNNREWNQQQAPEAPDLERRFAYPEVVIPVKCNIHAWMRSYIGVVEHPFFAVTDETGTFEWDGVPPGEYTVAAWHEKAGETTQKVTLGPNASATLAFTFR